MGAGAFGVRGGAVHRAGLGLGVSGRSLAAVVLSGALAGTAGSRRSVEVGGIVVGYSVVLRIGTHSECDNEELEMRILQSGRQSEGCQ